MQTNTYVSICIKSHDAILADIKVRKTTIDLTEHSCRSTLQLDWIERLTMPKNKGLLYYPMQTGNYSYVMIYLPSVILYSTLISWIEQLPRKLFNDMHNNIIMVVYVHGNRL